MKIERKPFLARMETLKPALGVASGSIQELKHIWFDGEFAYAFNGGLGIRLECKTEFKLGVPGTPLLGLLSDQSVEACSLEPGKGSLDIKLGNATAKMVTLPFDSSPWGFPADPPKGKDAALIPLTKGLLGALRRASLVRASKPSRVEHHGVMLFPSEDLLGLYSTDNRALVEISLEDVKLSLGFPKIVLPFAFLDAMLDCCLEGDLLHVTSSCLMAVGAKVQVCSNVMDISDVNDLPMLVDSLLKDGPTFHAVPDGVRKALDRVEVMAGIEDAVAVISCAGKEMTISGKFQFGDLNEVLPLKQAVKKPCKVVVDAMLLCKGLTEGKHFAITERGMLMQGDDGFLFVLALYG